MTDELVGRQFGNYRLQRLLGRGSFADVYRGEHIYLKTLAAIKILRLHLVDEACSSFLHEAQMVANLEHPHIVRVLEFGIEDSVPFLVMSYAPSGSMRQHFHRGSIISPQSIALYLKQIAAALDYAHSRKLIHRDVKPENILLKHENEAVLSDFGLATVKQSVSGMTPANLAGTLLYMAPEQLQGEVCPASDQYALGVTVYEWLTGRHPFDGTDREVIMRQIYMSPPSMNGDISQEIDAVVRQALMKDPAQRFPSAGDFAHHFERAAAIFSNLSRVDSSHPLRTRDFEEPALPLSPAQKNAILLLETKNTSDVAQKAMDLQLDLLPTRPLAAIAASLKTLPESVDSQSDLKEQPKRHTRRTMLFGAAGIISAGVVGGSLIALLSRAQPQNSSSPSHQATGTSGSGVVNNQGTTRAGAPSSPSSKGKKTVVSTTPSSQTPTPGGTSPTAGPSATSVSGSNPPLSIQITQYPAQLFNGQTATITVQANEPNVNVTLNVTYNIPPGKPTNLTQAANSQGQASFSWSIKLSHGKKDISPMATLAVSAQDTNGQNATASPLILPVIQD